MLALRRGPFPEAAFARAEEAYGDDFGRKLVRRWSGWRRRPNAGMLRRRWAWIRLCWKPPRAPWWMKSGGSGRNG
jgi:hypothetical protein